MNSFKNIQINESVTNLGKKLNSCYLVVEEVIINKDFSLFTVNVYKTKLDYETNAEWTIKVEEIKQFNTKVENNENVNFYNYISSVIVDYLCNVNNWKKENLIIE